MKNGIRKHVVVSNEHDRLMKELNKKTGASESWIMRKALDEFFKKQEQEK